MNENNLPLDKIGRRENKVLNRNLSPDEKVLGACVGAQGQTVVLTNKKVLIIKCGYMSGNTFGGKATTFTYDTISSVEISTNLLYCIFEIASGGVQGFEKYIWTGKGNANAFKAPNTVPFVRTRKGNIDRFQALANYIREHKHASQQNTDIPEQIKKLDDLHKQGILTAEEFEAKKKELLTRI